MSFTLKAPYPGVQTITILPSPQWGNSEGRVQEINMKRSISGQVRTYVKRGTLPDGTPRSKMQWSFVLTRNKAIELLEFTKAYHSSQIQIFDHADREYRGYIMNNPLEISPVRRGAPSIQDMPRGELCEVTLEFEGEAFAPPRPPAVFNRSALSSIQFLSTNGNLLPTFPSSVYGLKYHWDSWDLAGYSHGDRVNTWPASAYASQNVALVKHPSGSQPYTFNTPAQHDYAPYYVRNIMGQGMPSVYFGSTASTVITNTAMRSQSDTHFFPNKRGTVIWVMQHHVGAPPGSANRFFQLTSELTVWGLRHSSSYRPVDAFSIVGGAASWWPPATWRSTGTSGDRGSDYGWELPTLNEENPSTGNYVTPNVLARGRPYIMVIQRNNGNIRFRANALEFPGRTIINYPGTYGKFTYGLMNLALTGYGAVARGCLGEFMVWDRSLSQTEIERVESYLSEKWAIPLEFWDWREDCFPDWCLTYPHWCSGGVNTYTPNFNGTPERDFEEADIIAGQSPQYGTCCGDNS